MQAVSTEREFRQNSILASLNNREYEQIHPHLETIDFTVKKSIYSYGDALTHVYFPLDSVVCLSTTLEDGATVEAGIIGSEGILGISSVFGIKYAVNQAVHLSNKKMLRLRADVLKHLFETCETLRNVVLQYFHALYIQISQTSACNRHHNTDLRLCRWLLMMHDRQQSDSLEITHEFIAEMLGTRRPYVTTAAGVLQKQGIIECSRGHIEILDRRALEDKSCECYQIIKDGFRSFNHSREKEKVRFSQLSQRQPQIY